MNKSVALVGLLLPGLLFAAGEIEVSLLADSGALAAAVAEVLELDEQGRSTLSDDACNHVELAEVEVRPGDVQVGVSMALTVTVGARMMGACRGPTPWRGQLRVGLTPSVDGAGLAVAFAPESIELLRPDGSPGLLSRPAEVLAGNLIVPRLARVQLDLAGPLASLDELIEQWLNPAQATGPALAERSRIGRVDSTSDGIRAWLMFRVSPVESLPGQREPALEEAEWSHWQRLEDELDGFVSMIIARLAEQTAADGLRLELLATLLDTRHAIAEALLDEQLHDDPVRRLFLDSWARLRPLLATLESHQGSQQQAGLRLAAFLAGGDVLHAIDALGPEYGVEVTRDGLRRLARLLLEEEAPASFTPLPLNVDPALRSLFGFDPDVLHQTSRTSLPRRRQAIRALHYLAGILVPSAHATGVSPAEALQGRVPRLASLDEYLDLVAALLEEQAGTWLATNERIPERLRARFDPLVRATAWKESCWRQFTGPVSAPQVLTSPVGALGMMQINGRVWRNLYDLDRLANEVDYNVIAGIEILEHYLVDYAIRRGEHEHPGGDDNLVRATYAAYNGGPSHLARYRRDETPGRLRAIDNEFWRHYSTIKQEQWPDISSCYAVGG